MLATRATADELMDADDLDEGTYSAVVRDLAQVNTLTMARRPTLAFLADVVRRKLGQSNDPATKRVSLKILDVGFGDGDMLRAVHHWGAARSIDLTLVGIDLNPRSAPAARSRTPGAMRIDYRTGDYESCAGEGYDCVLSSLVAHHMTPTQLIAFLRFMDRESESGWFVNDLHRHGFAYVGFPLLATLMRWHPIVRHDGRLSIARSYRPDEWPVIFEKAGITGATVARVFPFRLCVTKLR